jgi:trans-aconitate methyltransferase
MVGTRAHWEHVYGTVAPAAASWHQDNPALSLELIAVARPNGGDAVIDVGGGASLLVDVLLARGRRGVCVLDISERALGIARARLGDRAAEVEWIAADVSAWHPARRYGLWHDRAVFHFLTDAWDRHRYVRALRAALRPDGHCIIAGFAPDGPQRCSGLDVRPLDAASVQAELGPEFAFVEQRHETHLTPAGREQRFVYLLFQRVPESAEQ